MKGHVVHRYAALGLLVAVWLSLFVLPGVLASLATRLPLEPSVPWVAAAQPSDPEGRCLRSSVAVFAVSVITAVALELVASVGILLRARSGPLRLCVLVTMPLFQLALFSDTLRVLARDWHFYVLSRLHLFTLADDSARYTHPLSEPRYPIASGIALLLLLACLRARRIESSA